MDLFFKLFSSSFFRLLTSLFILFLFVLWFSLIYWTYRDAAKRGALSLYWAIVVFFFNIFGWLVYLVVRPSEYLEEVKDRELDIKTKEALLTKSNQVCSACLNPIEEEFLVCPYCFKKLKKACPQCGRPLKMSWTICPYCKATL